MNKGLKIFIACCMSLLFGCTNISTTPNVLVDSCRQWGIATFANNTEIPQAGNRAMSVTMGILRSRGVHVIQMYPSNATCSQLVVCPNATGSVDEVLAWARRKHITYVMMGAVNEWDYKVGLDGEPAVAVSLQLYNAQTQQLIWSGVGSKIGTSRSGLGVIAQALIAQILYSLKII